MNTEDIRDLLSDLIEWAHYMGGFEDPVWDRARATRDQLSAELENNS